MTWTIGDADDGVTLPFGGPQSVKRRVIRKKTAESILSQMPFPVDLGPDSFQMQIKGLISPAAEATKLWEIVKKADQDSIPVVITNESEFEDFSNQYIINRSTVGISKPRFDENGKIVQNYDITFVEPPENIGNSDDAEKVTDEDGVGFGDLGDDFVFDFLNFILGVDLLI